MAVGGVSSQFFQQSQQLSAQASQLQREKSSQSAESLISRSSAAGLHNQQAHVTTLQNSLQRGQAMDMYV